MGRIKILFLLVSLFTGANVLAANYGLQKQVQKTLNKVDAKRQKVQLLEKQMKMLDSDLSAKNSEIESYNTKITEAHEKIDTLKSEARPMQDELAKLETELKKIVKQYVASKMDGEENPSNLYSQKMLMQVIGLDLEKLKIKKQENEATDLMIKNAEEDLLNIIKTKETLQSLMAEMKGKKEAIAFDLEEAKQAPVVTATAVPTSTPIAKVVVPKTKPLLESKKSTSEEILKLVPETLPEDKDAAALFSSPLNTFVQVSNSSKGLTYTFGEVTQVLCPGDGVVVFAGELSTYGNVVMIDHGSEIRTVLLGNFQPKVRKHDKLTQGELIGYTEMDASKKNTLYFEVRKKNVAQNTVRYLNKNLLKSRL